MKKIILLLVLVFFPFPGFAADIQNGISKIDFDGDGVEEIVVKAWRGNGNAHGFYGISFYKQDEKEGLSLIEVGEEPMVYTTQGADCVLRDYWIVPHGGKKNLVAAHRPIGAGFTAQGMVTFKIYSLKENSEGVPGIADWFFSLEKTLQSNGKYCDVREALKELK